MEPVSNSHIVITVYYRQTKWHNLLQFIHPLLTKLCKLKKLDWYYIELGISQGDYVRFIFHPSDNRGKLEKTLLKQIQHYLEDHPSDEIEIVYPLNSYFMSYPNNTVWINHNRTHKTIYAVQNDLGTMQMRISQTLIAACATEEMTWEDTCTFFVYMQLGMIKTFFSDIDQAAAMVETLASLENPVSIPDIKWRGQEDRADDFFGKMFQENRDILTEIVQDIWSSNDPEKELSWLIHWEIAVRRFVNDSDIRTAFFRLNGLIYKQVMFLENVHLPLLSLKLIARVFASMRNRSNVAPAFLD